MPAMTSSRSPIEEYLNTLKVEFAFDITRAKKLISSFHEEMRRGLAGKKSSLKMISSFVKRPSGKEKGRFLALDLGGTNFRVMAVELSGKRSSKILGAVRYTIPKELTAKEGELLFDFIAASLESFLTDSNLSRDEKYGLGFTFSFPVRQTGIKNGKLISWTKGFSSSNVVGNDVVGLLERAICKRNIKCVSVEALVNDTVGTLVAKSYETSGCGLGVILGTGTNACYPEEKKQAGVIINTEWGNFDKFEGNSFDKTLDSGSNNKGKQLFEKAVSGMYLGEIFRLVLKNMAEKGMVSMLVDEPYSVSSKYLSELASRDSLADEDILRKVAKLISVRSARLAASAIAAILLWEDKKLTNKHVVAIDGSLYEKYPGYKSAMILFLKEILGERAKKIRFELAKDGSGVGAAIVAAVASKNKREGK